MEDYGKSLFFIGFISNYGEMIAVDKIYFNHTKLAEKIVANDPRLKKKMAKSKHYIAIDFLIYEMGYLKVGNKKHREILYSCEKTHSKAIKDYIIIYESLGYTIVKV